MTMHTAMPLDEISAFTPRQKSTNSRHASTPPSALNLLPSIPSEMCPLTDANPSQP